VEIALGLWIALWVLMGYAVDRKVRGVAKLGDTVVLAGRSVGETATALHSIADVPFVGSNVRRLATSARRTAHSAVVNGGHARDDANQLATLLWITVAAAPSLPAIAAYGWFRAGPRKRA
jgi:hypothetical protein